MNASLTLAKRDNDSFAALTHGRSLPPSLWFRCTGSQHALRWIGKTLRSMSNSRSKDRRPMASRTERRRAAVERRRQHSRRSVTAQVAARRRRTRIRWASAAAAVVVLGAGTAVFVATRPDGGIPKITLTGKKVSDADGALGITAPLPAYTVNYELKNYATDPKNPDLGTETIRASRPFSAEVTASSGTGETVSTSDLITVLGKQSGAQDGADATVSVIPPTGGLGDFRLDASLDDLVASGKYELKERRTVIDRECQVYRTGSALESLSVTAPTDDTYADMCIDASGILLEEVVYSGGLPQSHLIAVSVDEQPVDDIAIDAEPTDTTTTLTEIDATTPPIDGYWALSAVPDGYTLTARYAYSVPGEATDTTTDTTVAPTDTTVAPTDTTAAPTATTAAPTAATTLAPADTTADTAQGFAGSDVISAVTTAPAADTTAPADTVAPETTTTTAAPAAPPIVSYADVYTNGIDFLIIRQGPSSQEPTPAGATADATITALGAVTNNSGYDGSTIVAHPASPADWFVTINGSVDLATLSGIATTLTQATS
jgi:hypothetical protein